MSEQQKRPIGRPLTTEPGKRYSLSAKTSLETNLALKAAASASGRSVSQEIERRLEASFHDDDAMRVIRETIRQEMRAEFAGREAAQTEIEAAQRKMVFDMHENARREREATPTRNGDWGYGLGQRPNGL